jgi:hypothetical protein
MKEAETEMLEKDWVLQGGMFAFFAAMLRGYFGDSMKTTAPDRGTIIEFVSAEYKVIDHYYTTPQSLYSVGTTMIYFKDIPIWWMSYGGFYQHEAIPFLKDALRATYEEKKFLGGRGPRTYLKDGLCYENIVAGDLKLFRGREEIRQQNPHQVLGFHEYQGMSLL